MLKEKLYKVYSDNKLIAIHKGKLNKSIIDTLEGFGCKIIKQ